LERILTESVESGRFTTPDLFDENYQLIPDTAPKKYHTKYDSYLDQAIQAFEDALLEDNHVVYAVLTDRNGYVPTHNSRYSQPLTGDAEKDKLGNRTKRIFDDPVGLAAAHYDGTDGKGYLQQVYERDTGEKMWDISAPVFVKGRHWGGFRIGYQMD
jgi:hypothetical protein